EKLIIFRGQKRWIFLPGIGSPGKAGNNRTLEAVGSTPIGSTKFFKRLDMVPTPSDLPRFPVRIFDFDGVVDAAIENYKPRGIKHRRCGDHTTSQHHPLMKRDVRHC